MQAKQTKPIFCDPDVTSYLESLNKHFVSVTIVKAANNFVFICKIITSLNSSKLLAEVRPAEFGHPMPIG